MRGKNGRRAFAEEPGPKALPPYGGAAFDVAASGSLRAKLQYVKRFR
jgi:hypothetical protein